MAPKRVRACNLLDELTTSSGSFRLKDQILVKLERDIHNAWMRRADLLTQCSNILADSGKRQDYIAEMELLSHSEIADLSMHLRGWWAATLPGYHGTSRHNQGVYRHNGNIQVDAPKNVAFRLWVNSYFVLLLVISYVFSILFAVFCLYIMNLLANFDVFWLGNEILCICLVLAVLACRFFFMVFVVIYKVATIHATSDNCTVF